MPIPRFLCFCLDASLPIPPPAGVQYFGAQGLIYLVLAPCQLVRSCPWTLGLTSYYNLQGKSFSVLCPVEQDPPARWFRLLVIQCVTHLFLFQNTQAFWWSKSVVGGLGAPLRSSNWICFLTLLSIGLKCPPLPLYLSKS